MLLGITVKSGMGIFSLIASILALLYILAPIILFVVAVRFITRSVDNASHQRTNLEIILREQNNLLREQNELLKSHERS